MYSKKVRLETQSHFYFRKSKVHLPYAPPESVFTYGDRAW